MALQRYRIARFYSIDQSMCENDLDAGMSPAAHNMDTAGGRLTVAKGYVHHSETPHPAPDSLRRMFIWHKGGVQRFILFTEQGLTVLREGESDWQTLHSFAEGVALTDAQQDFLPMKLGSTEMLLMASGAAGMLKWDGEAETPETFGSAEQLSDRPTRLVELYYSRLFAAGDPDYPSRLYWSAAPGDERSVEDWTSMEASADVSGGHVEVGTDSDPITGLIALSNQLLIVKRGSLYRLLGDRPSNFRIFPVNAVMAQPLHSACVRCGDVLYFLTKTGLYYYDGQTVQRAADADRVQNILAEADLSACEGTACGDKLYFAFRMGKEAMEANDAMLVFDRNRRSYMLRDGFTVRAMCADNGTLYIVDGDGYICRFDEGESYAGREIHASWRTPMTDLGGKIAVKHLKELYLRGSGGIIAVSAKTGSGTVFFERLMPTETPDVLEATLSGDGRAFCLELANVNGSRFTVDGGVELLFDAQRRVL